MQEIETSEAFGDLVKADCLIGKTISTSFRGSESAVCQ